MPLTRKQDCFCREYVKARFNGAAAYRAAYPSCKSDGAARANASRLLSNAIIQKRIAEIGRSARAEEDITPARVMRELGFLAFQRGSHLYHPDGTLKDPAEWDEAVDATIANLEVEEEVEDGDGRNVTTRTRKVKRHDKAKALELLMRHFGMLKPESRRPERPLVDLSQFSDAQKQILVVALRLLGNPPGGSAGSPVLPATRT